MFMSNYDLDVRFYDLGNSKGDKIMADTKLW